MGRWNRRICLDVEIGGVCLLLLFPDKALTSARYGWIRDLQLLQWGT